jgi:predicted nucleotidyltransferase
MSHGLSAEHCQIILQVLAPYANSIVRVDIFGSRAQGTHRHNSDLDLVVHGNVSESTIDRLWTLFQESPLPFSVDIKSFEHIQYAPLKAHMDAVCLPLFTHDELMQAQAAMALRAKPPT